VPAIVVSLGVAAALAFGMRESATVNLILVMIKVLALIAFIALALPAFEITNFEPFAPYGFGSTVDADGVKRGIMAAAAIIFFAFYGFDAVSTAAEETHHPQRDLKIGIIGSMLICTVLYMAVAGAALGGADHRTLAASGEPLALVLRNLHHPLAATLIAGVAVVALPTVIMAFMFGQSRVFFVMARDGLLPQQLSAVHPRFGTPVQMTLITGVVVAAIGALLPLQRIVELANAGTLVAFISVGVCLLVMRAQAPDHVRVFRAPLPWVIAPLAIVGCIYLFTSLPLLTVQLFFLWMVLGLVVYFAYARHRSALNAVEQAS
jgi:APA family basic amino acid/polyamine antiporter